MSPTVTKTPPKNALHAIFILPNNVDSNIAYVNSPNPKIMTIAVNIPKVYII